MWIYRSERYELPQTKGHNRSKTWSTQLGTINHPHVNATEPRTSPKRTRRKGPNRHRDERGRSDQGIRFLLLFFFFSPAIYSKNGCGPNLWKTPQPGTWNSRMIKCCFNRSRNIFWGLARAPTPRYFVESHLLLSDSSVRFRRRKEKVEKSKEKFFFSFSLTHSSINFVKSYNEGWVGKRAKGREICRDVAFIKPTEE